MQAFRILEPQKAELRQVPVPEPAPGQGLGKVEFCHIVVTHTVGINPAQHHGLSSLSLFFDYNEFDRCKPACYHRR